VAEATGLLCRICRPAAKKNRKTVKKGHEGPFFWEKEDALMAFFCAVF
jgi:hypothetical protein